MVKTKCTLLITKKIFLSIKIQLPLLLDVVAMDIVVRYVFNEETIKFLRYI